MEQDKRASIGVFIIICAATLIFMTGCSLLRRKSSFPDPDRLVKIATVAPTTIPSGKEGAISGWEFLAWRNQSQSFAQMSAYTARGFNWIGGTEPERFFCGQVDAGFFSLLGVGPLLGRTFLPEEDRPDGSRVVILGYRLWQRIFDGDPSTIGKTMTLNQEKYTVIGVMPAEFQFPEEYDAWLPLAIPEQDIQMLDEKFGLKVIARLKPGITRQQAQAELNIITQERRAKALDANQGGIKVEPLIADKWPIIRKL